MSSVTLTKAQADVISERRRQVEAEGWTPEHDDKHADGSLASAAACYAIPPDKRTYVIRFYGINSRVRLPEGWPWHADWWKPKDRRRDLVRAAALIIAEIEKMDRAAASEPEARESQNERSYAK